VAAVAAFFGTAAPQERYPLKVFQSFGMGAAKNLPNLSHSGGPASETA
jgi:hypothetical protein